MDIPNFDFPEFTPEPLPDPGPRPTYTSREDVMAALERSVARGHHYFYEVENKGLAVGDGSPDWGDHPMRADVREWSLKSPVWGDVLVSLDMLKVLRDEGLVTSWRNDSTPPNGNSKGHIVQWYLGDLSEWAFEGPGWVNGERQEQ